MIRTANKNVLIAMVLLLVLAGVALGQTNATRQGSAPSGSGVFVAGDYWEGFTPDNLQPYTANRWWRETNGADALNNHVFMVLGNYNRSWDIPIAMWPGGWNWGQLWNSTFRIAEFNPDPNFFPNSPHNSPNKANYAFGTFGSKLAGENDPNRNYIRLTKWVDDNKRTQAVYEFGFPTTLGVDVKVTARQFTVNWANLNDFIVFEMTFTNTGVLDMNKDGVAEKTNNKINALCVGWNGTPMISYWLSSSGGRNNDFNVGRNSGYVGDLDATGAPWDMCVTFPGAEAGRVRADRTVAPGKNNVGVNGAQTLKSYTDVWTFNSFLAVKKGTASPANPDKTTIYGTHPIGVGPERGYYHAVMQGNGIAGLGGDAPPTNSTPEGLHQIFMGCWYKNGGKDNNAATQDFNPNPNFFASGTKGNPLTFVPKSSGATRPNGDKKLYSDEVGVAAFSQGPWEDGKADATTNYPNGYGKWTKGFVWEHTFSGDIINAVGPFSLDVGETITVVWVEGGGYRLEGVQRALEAARWAYTNAWGPSPAGYNEAVLPTPPPAPDMLVDKIPGAGKNIVRWDKRAESDPNFAGYKVWRSQTVPPITLIDGGMRLMDRYQEQMALGATKPEFVKPVNPKFDAKLEVQTLWSADLWGPYNLMKVIPKSELSQYLKPSAPYDYAFEDRDDLVLLGAAYWYYVAAYAEKPGGYTGPGGLTTSRIESHKVNVNGRSGLWMGTYPFASSGLNSFLPKTQAELKSLGVGYVVSLETPSISDITSGARKIYVKPNPFKRKAFFGDKVAFVNIPDNARITILDVAGQIVLQKEIRNPASGVFFWDLYSKDGLEVANGLYIYVVEYPGGQEVNYFSILR